MGLRDLPFPLPSPARRGRGAEDGLRAFWTQGPPLELRYFAPYGTAAAVPSLPNFIYKPLKRRLAPKSRTSRAEANLRDSSIARTVTDSISSNARGGESALRLRR